MLAHEDGDNREDAHRDAEQRQNGAQQVGPQRLPGKGKAFEDEA